MPLACEPLWREIQRVLREDYGIVHWNKAVEAGMHVEILMAEFFNQHFVIHEGSFDRMQSYRDRDGETVD